MAEILGLPLDVIWIMVEQCTQRDKLMLAATCKEFRAFIIPKFLPAKASERRKVVRDEEWQILLEEEKRQRQAHADRLASGSMDFPWPPARSIQLACHSCLKLLPSFHFQFTETFAPENHLTGSKRTKPLPRKCMLCRIDNQLFVDLTHSENRGQSIELNTCFQMRVMTVCVYCKDAYFHYYGQSSPCLSLVQDAISAQLAMPQSLPPRHYCPEALKQQEEHDWEDGDRLRRDVTLGSAYVSPAGGKGAMCLQSCCRDRYRPVVPVQVFGEPRTAYEFQQAQFRDYVQTKTEATSLRKLLKELNGDLCGN